MAKPAKPVPAATEGAAKPKNNKMLIIILAVVLVIAGGAGWYFFKGNQPHNEAKAPTPLAEPKFIALDPFTVNLQKEETDQFLQIGITLKVTEQEMEEKVKAHLPEIRSHLLLLLSGKRASELIPADGKVKLAQEVIAETEAALGLHAAPAQTTAASAPPATHADEKSSGKIDVLFTSFIIQ
ncbi:MAG: flagellar basal body-associated protein FliL [Nitrosomonadales bacterium]|nr:flagellar basal body-associated protein FliL [Nitrosomonadales bacterium]